MPLVEIKVLENVFSEDDKKKLIADVTDVLVAFLGENLRDHILVIVQEVKTGNWVIGGQVLRSEDVKALRVGKGSPEL